MRDVRRAARVALVAGIVLLSIAAALAIWELSSPDTDSGPVPITGEVDTP